MKSVILLIFIAAISLAAEIPKDVQVEESTQSPLADMPIVDNSFIKTSTEKPPVGANEQRPSKEERDNADAAQRKTVADFIIHPLIAFKPRTEEDDAPVGKQANASTTSSSPWQLFGFNGGQGFGSSVSSLAGSVTGWLSDRIQLPGLVDTPVRETTTTTTTSTTTTTTPRPEIIVRVQHRQRPHNFNNNKIDFESEEEQNGNRFSVDDVNGDEYDDDEYENDNNNSNHNENEDSAEQSNNAEESIDDNEGNEYEEDEEEEEEDDIVQRPINQRPLQNQRHRYPQGNRFQSNRRRIPVSQRLRPQQFEASYEDDADDDDNDEFYYGTKYSSSRRSQNQPNFLQRGQQSLINQIRQLTNGHTPAEIADEAQQDQKPSTHRRQQGTLLVNRSGQPIYMASQLQQNMNTVRNPSRYPQPPLTTPIKRKGRPTQYITIPWSQLGITPPNKIVSVAEGLQSQPLVFRMPPNAIAAMQNNKNKRPVITAEAVPLLAEASIMDIFKPPKIPPSRSATVGLKPTKKHENRVMIASNKPKPTTATYPQRIKPATIVERAGDEMQNQPEQRHNKANHMSRNEKEYIMVGDDNEPGLTRQAQPVYGNARYFGKNPIFEVLANGRFALRNGRALQHFDKSEQTMPEQVVGEQPVEVQRVEDHQVQPFEKQQVEVQQVDVQQTEPEKVQQKEVDQEVAQEPQQVVSAIPVETTLVVPSTQPGIAVE